MPQVKFLLAHTCAEVLQRHAAFLYSYKRLQQVHNTVAEGCMSKPTSEWVSLLHRSYIRQQLT